ncbi:ribosome maturation factor RimM [Qingshengfaniella alkalisoli]|uniref:Ribosome maturation factor RimM n=1 Tax=Qingshengfaniella alkalisoli TaxID=2599296 RepID=A0A5B8IYL5_9RHOB|nr:ribosome maturation factor RimM [Qingshengfaniella alkalisoli]QDY69748.1 ribosome maturation factor RimM [Qingshengfaniella alkalisoli]
MGDKVCVGAIAGAYGVRGEVRLKSFTADPEAIGDYGPLTTEDGAHSYSIKVTGQIKNGLAARLGGISNKEQADKLRGTKLFAPRDRLPALPDDEFYHADLIGLDVFDTGGTLLGKVRAIHDHGAGDLLEIFGKGWKDTVLLPFTREAVPTVDLTAGRIIADPPDGLIPEPKQ